MKHFFILLLFLPFSCGAQTISINASDTVICNGSLVTFSAIASGVPSAHYQWFINSLNTGADSLSFSSNTLINGDTVICRLTNVARDTVFAASNYIVITVQSPPYAGVITGTDSFVCVGTSVTLHSIIPGGMWAASNSHANVVGGVVTGISPGFFECPYPIDDTIFYIVTNACGADTSFKVLSVNSLPDTYFELGGGANFVCVHSRVSVVGSATDFRCAGELSSKYGFVSIGSDIFGVNVGIDTIFSIATNQCGTSMYKTMVQVLDKPKTVVVTPSYLELCPGSKDSILLSYSGYSLSVFSSDTYALAITSELVKFSTAKTVFTANTPGFDAFTIRINNNCGYTDMHMIVKVKAAPGAILGADSICRGYSASLSNAVTGGAWSTVNTDILQANNLNGTITGINIGVGNVTYTLPDGCSASKVIKVMECKAEAVIFPDPAHEEINIHLYVEDYSSYSIINVLGQVMLSQSLAGIFTRVSTGALIPGIYFVRLNGNGKTTSMKFLKD